MKKTFHITAEGKKELEVELEELKGRRGSIAEKIANARDYGDLSENAEYDSAREEQGLVESRISDSMLILSSQPRVVQSVLAQPLCSKMAAMLPIRSSVQLKQTH